MTIINTLASIADQRQVMLILRSLETPPDESVRECDLVQKAFYMSIGHPEECINELITTGLVYRVKAPSGDMIRRTEK